MLKFNGIIKAPMTSILKRVGIERPYLVKEIAFLCGMAVEDEKHFVMECDSLSTYRNTFFDKLEEIVPSLSSKNVDEKFSFIMECKDYDISFVCITKICIMFRAREELVKFISAP